MLGGSLLDIVVSEPADIYLEFTMQILTSYLICATQRSGSYLLCEALKNTGIAGKPEEYF